MQRNNLTKYSYTLKVGEKGRDRLKLLNELVNPFSDDFIASVTQLQNKNILEVGCGIGIMTSKFALSCLPNGRVLATDISNEQLKLAKENAKNLDITNITFQQIPASLIDQLNLKFDIIYFRFVLGHLPNALEILQKTVTLMHAESLLICEEIENVETMFCDPPSKAFYWWQDAMNIQIKSNQGDFTVGKRLFDFFKQLNLTIMNTKSVQPMMVTSALKQQLWLGIVEINPILITSGFATQTEIDNMITDLKILAYSPLTKVGMFCLRQIAAKKSNIEPEKLCDSKYR